MEGADRREERQQAEAAERAWLIHKSQCEKWQEGRPKETWEDNSGCLCVRYESGRWWHYRQNGSGGLEWW